MKTLKAKCAWCHEVVKVSQPREYKTCKCGRIGLDFGDGYYYRIIGSPSDFDKKFDEENGIKRFESFKSETPETKEHEVDTVYGAPILPADLLIDNVTGWFEEKGLHDVKMQMVKTVEELGELAHEISRGNTESRELVDALGDIIVTIIGLCHHLNIPFEAALSLAWNEIKDRKGKVINGSFVKDILREEGEK